MHYNLLKKIKNKDELTKFDPSFGVFQSTKFVKNDGFMKICILFSLHSCFERQFSLNVPCFPMIDLLVTSSTYLEICVLLLIIVFTKSRHLLGVCV